MHNIQNTKLLEFYKNLVSVDQLSKPEQVEFKSRNGDYLHITYKTDLNNTILVSANADISDLGKLNQVGVWFYRDSFYDSSISVEFISSNVNQDYLSVFEKIKSVEQSLVDLSERIIDELQSHIERLTQGQFVERFGKKRWEDRLKLVRFGISGRFGYTLHKMFKIDAKPLRHSFISNRAMDYFVCCRADTDYCDYTKIDDVLIKSYLAQLGGIHRQLNS